jgi:hypothetical protein
MTDKVSVRTDAEEIVLGFRVSEMIVVKVTRIGT